jgi:hypothetical protein
MTTTAYQLEEAVKLLGNKEQSIHGRKILPIKEQRYFQIRNRDTSNCRI